MDMVESNSALEDRPLVADDSLDTRPAKQKIKRKVKKSSRSRSKSKERAIDDNDDEKRRMLLESEGENSESPSFVEDVKNAQMKNDSQQRPKQNDNIPQRLTAKQQNDAKEGEINEAFQREEEEGDDNNEIGNKENSTPNADHQGTSNVNEEMKEAKPKKKKKRKKDAALSANNDPALPLIASSEEGGDPRLNNDDDNMSGPVFGVVIHRAEQLQMDDQLIFHPVVVVSIVDAVTGQPVAKSVVDRPVSSFYETRNEKVTTILPF